MSEKKEKSGSAKKWLVRIGVGLACGAFAISLLVLVGFGHIKYLSIVMSAICALILHEVMGVSGCKNKHLTRYFMVVSAIIPVYYSFGVKALIESKIPGFTVMLLITYLIVTLIIMLKIYETIRFENVAIGLFMSLAAPLAFLTLMFTYDIMGTRGDLFCRSQQVLVLLLAMYSAWLCDSFALFAGSAFGKHKMAPKISPKKTIEGAIGGALGTTIFAIITFFIAKMYFKPEVADTIKWWMVLIIVPIVCVFGMCGDLAASVIKRNYGVKDFGTLLPEHGGAMDRVDSFLFAMPATYVIVRFLIEVCG